MENLTCVIDAQTLVENVHEIKDWVYNGSIRLHVPICASEKLEQQYQAWLKAQEALKDPQPKRSSYKTATRKDHPLFDVNPRVGREFLLRSQADPRNSNVSFQQPDEQFTQWKEEEEQALKVEQIPEERPTSFAQALLRKLNIAEEGEGTNGPKASAKPRLVARDTAVPKSPWKYHKVPTISSRGVPESMKPLLGCVLWRLHEYENNPLLPETCIMLTDNSETTEFMVKLKIPVTNVRQLHQKLNTKQIEDARDNFGLVENEFAAKKRDNVMAQVEPMNIKVNGAMSVHDIEKESRIEDTAQSANLNKGLHKLENPIVVNGGPLTSTISQEDDHSVEHLTLVEQVKDNLDTPYPDDFHEHSLTPKVSSMVESSENQEDNARIDVIDAVDDQPPPPCTRSGSVSMQTVSQCAEAEPSSRSTTSVQTGQTPAIAVELSDRSDDSDDEVVVFNPKSRRLSGTPKTSSEPPMPIEPAKPSTPISYLKALEIGLPKRPVSAPKSPALTKAPDIPNPEQSDTHDDKLKSSAEAVSDPQIFIRESSHNKHPNHPQHRNRSQRPHQRSLTIKAQNARQTLIPSPVPAQIKQRPPPELDPLSQKHIETLLSDETRDFSRVEEFVALQTRDLMTPTSQLPEVLLSQGDNIPRNLSVHNDQDLSTAVQAPHQHQQFRQRPHPRQSHRFDQGSPKFPRQPNKPQTISYPTIIDPDDFDRSPIIQLPRIHTSNGNSHNHHRMPGSPKRGGVSKSTEPEVDFVLKSGAPRGSTRGRGKLWVP